ncbi:hypothetical protein C8R48DRAFT_703048 [Suillus tomentosus]|nr:hypothetical protein C8R48DRAFT_703048 [Suillus tomentosus]
MHLSFQVVLAVVAALAVSMVVSVDSDCTPIDEPCNSGKDCCDGYYCYSVDSVEPGESRYDGVGGVCTPWI